jgi:hypothetical protein
MLLVIVWITPTQKFIALTTAERRALLGQLAAPIQEWTGADGGVVFSERTNLEDGSWSVVLVIMVRSEGLAEVIRTGMSKAVSDGYFLLGAVQGPFLGLRDSDDPEQAQRLTDIVAPFLEP